MRSVMRSVAGPIECAEHPDAEDCTDREVVASHLIASRMVVEIDARVGPYGHCNICLNATRGKVTREDECHPELLHRYRCSGYGLLPGRVGHELPNQTHPTACNANMEPWMCWRNRVALKVRDWRLLLSPRPEPHVASKHGMKLNKITKLLS